MEAADSGKGAMSVMLLRWHARGWLERRVVRGRGNPCQWRLTREGRTGAHALIRAVNEANGASR